MKIKNILLAIAATAVICACHNGQQAAADNDTIDSLTELEEEMIVDTTPMPMFLYYHNPDNMQVVFWASLAKPDEPDANWDLQQRTRRIASQYTKLLLPNGKFANVKFIGEQTKDPDGGDLEVFALHHDYAPSAGLNYAFENKKEAKAIKYGGTMLVVATEEYLESHKMLNVKNISHQKSMPKNVVKELETRYSMKATRSVVTCEIEGGYSFGAVQFKPKGDKVLALQVLACSDSIYSIEEWGHYDKTEGATWNVDDGGEYIPSGIMAAFEGPNGLDLCYLHGAPESTTTGWMTLRKGAFNSYELAQFYNYIDEPMPFYKKDMTKLQKILEKHDPMFKNIKMTKWTYVWIDNDDVREIWLRSNDEEYGAIFGLKGEPQLLCTEYGNRKAILYQDAISVTGSCGSGCFNMEVVTLKDSRRGDRLELMRNTAPDNSISSEEYRLNGKIINKSEGEKFIQQATKQEHYLKSPNWNTFDK